MQEVYIQSSIAILKIIATNENILSIINDDFFYSYIPSVVVLHNNNIQNIDATIRIEETTENILNINYPEIYYGYKKLNIKDIISLIEFVFERARQEKGIICIHGAGAIIDNKLIACWGPASGMGKTSLAIKLSENNGTFYSDEKILIDLKNKKAVGRIKSQYLSNEYWKEKYGNKEYYEHTNLAKDIAYEVGLFVQPIICEQSSYTLDIWEPNKFLWHLYEESSRKIRGTSRIFFDNTYPAMSLDTESTALNRLNLLKDFVNSVPAIYFKGSSKVAVELIMEKL